MASPVIELDNVSFAYGSVPVLENVTIEIQEGEFASIVGPNGGGKTTLARIMLGLLTPQGGRVRLFGDDPSKTRLKVGYTPQCASVDFQFPITVEEIVLAGRLGVKTPGVKCSFVSRLFSGMRFGDVDRIAARAAMERMQIMDLAARSFGDLSGGQKQRVFIARALAADPQLLILDEPTNNIDPSSMEKFYDLLTELNKTITILVVTHDMGVVSRYVGSVICVNRQVVVHPTTDMDGKAVRDLYGTDVRLILHNHRCSEQGHEELHCSK